MKFDFENMDKEMIILKLRNIKPILSKKYGLTELALFGSYSRNHQTDLSDIDLMVDFKNPKGMNYFDLVYELKDVFKDKEVQVVSKDGIRPKYFERIKQDLSYA